MIVLKNSKFKALVDEIGSIEPNSPSSFILLLEENLPVTVRLHPDEKQVYVECTVFDLTRITGTHRTIITQALLALNYQALGSRSFFIGLETRNYITVYFTFDLHQSNTESMLKFIKTSAEQSILIRNLITTLA
jgi:hypothetical protein